MCAMNDEMQVVRIVVVIIMIIIIIIKKIVLILSIKRIMRKQM